jgi:hypothetical protein
MASYYLSFKCDFCDKTIVVAITGINTYKQEEIFSPDATYDGICKNGHRSTYFRNQITEVYRKLSPLERQAEPELLGDRRFLDVIE